MMIEQIIRDYIKKHLKIKIEYVEPSTLFEGNVKASLYLDDELIDLSEQKIFKSFF